MKKNKIIDKIKKSISGTMFENKTFIAGGFVRDMIMVNDSDDIDICVEIPNGGILLADHLHKDLHKTSCPVIFERFGTAQLLIGDQKVEFVETRKEVYSSESRNPDTLFGSLSDDIKRRDFTINSLMYNISSGQIIDELDGKNDIENKVIRTCSDPDLIFSEDPLRMLRAIRFSARFEFIIEGFTLDSIKRNIDRLSIISKERIRDEFCKMIMNDNFEFAIGLLIYTDLIVKVGLPELKLIVNMKQPKRFHTKDVLNHTFEVMSRTEKTLEHRLAALLHDIGKCHTFKEENDKITFHNHQLVSASIAKRFLTGLKFSNDQIDKIITAIEMHMTWLTPDLKSSTIRRMLMNVGFEKIMFALDLSKADIKPTSMLRHDVMVRIVNETVKQHTDGQNKIIFPFTGNDIMEKFKIGPSKEVGRLMNLAKEIFVEDIELTKEEILEKIK